jgi:hypothetical protein
VWLAKYNDRVIAATVTWLEGRTNGTDQPTGTLVLALN